MTDHFVRAILRLPIILTEYPKLPRNVLLHSMQKNLVSGFVSRVHLTILALGKTRRLFSQAGVDRLPKSRNQLNPAG